MKVTDKKRSLWIGILFVAVLIVFMIAYGRKQGQEDPITATAFKLNTVVKVTIYDSQDETILQEAIALCDKYEKIFSRTRPDSEIYQLNEGTLPQEGPGITFYRKNVRN